MNTALNDAKDEVSKAELRVLARLFALEIESALSKNERLYQPNNKKSVALLESLKAKGMVKHVEERLGGRFPVTVRHWQLTLAGHAYYCMCC